MNVELTEALEPVLRDLTTSGAVRPEIRDEPWADDEPSAMLYGHDGSGQGVWVQADDALAERVATVTDQVQEWVIEELWSLHRPATWPECPAHPDTHPLQPIAKSDRACWICPATRDEIAEIGALPGH
jgi:hypothetical protein